MLPNDEQRRHAITELQRQKIRAYAHANPMLRQSDVAAWATRELGHKISQSTISDTLKPRFSYLDTKSFPRGVHGITRIYSAEYPVLEKALFEWVLRMEANKLPLSGDMIKDAAKSLWQRMPDFKDQPLPGFSNGWLTGFKRRHHIKQYKQSGELGSADIVGSQEQVFHVKSLIVQFGPNNTFNVDETALFWLLLPDRTLATKAQSGAKKKKDRITVLPCTNATGTIKLDLWILGYFKKPRAFGTDNIYIRNLPVVWRANASAWMTAVIFIEYLHWFDRQMEGKKVLLLVDGHSSHVAAVKQLKDQHGDHLGLRNTTIAFLPANTTSIYHTYLQLNTLKKE